MALLADKLSKITIILHGKVTTDSAWPEICEAYTVRTHCSDDNGAKTE